MIIDDETCRVQLGVRAAYSPARLWLALAAGGTTGPRSHGRDPEGYPAFAIEGHHGNFTQDGRYFLLLNRGPGTNLTGNEVVVFDAATKKQVARFGTTSTGIGHAYNTKDGRYAVITNYGNNVISLVDLKDFRESKALTIGKGRMGHVAFTADGRYGYVSNAGDGNLYKIDTTTWQVVREIETGRAPGGARVVTVWTNVFEELPR